MTTTHTDLNNTRGFANRPTPKPYTKHYPEDEDPTPTSDEQTPDTGNSDDPNRDDDLSPEERTFKKRYGDLRTHVNSLKTTYEAQIADLQRQLSEAATPSDLPNDLSDEELEEWVKANPRSAKVIERIATKLTKRESDVLNERVKEIEARSKEITKREAELQLAKLHPDFDQIREDPAFHEWVDGQPAQMQDILYGDDFNVTAVARLLSLYKYEAGIDDKPKPKNKQNNSDAATSVNTGRKGAQIDPTGKGGKKIWKESEIAKMSVFEFEKHEHDIMQAQAEGRLEYDLSGNR